MTEITIRQVNPNLTLEEFVAMEKWCEKNFGPNKHDRLWRWTSGRWWANGTYSFTFTHSEDAVLFSLRWL
jgi:hypothetical protein